MAITPQGFRLLVRIVEALAFLAIFVLMALQSVPLTFTNTEANLRYASLQQAISQRIAKDALLLQYGTSSDNIQAITELQNMLPTWESNQRALQNGNLPTISQTLFTSSQTNYVSIDTSVKAILAHPQLASENIAEIQITRTQERPYFLAISQVASDLQQQETESKETLFSIEEGTCIILLAIKTTFVFTVETTVAGYLKRENEREQERKQ